MWCARRSRTTFFCLSFAVAMVLGATSPMASLYRSPHRFAQPTASWNQTATLAKQTHTRLIDTTRRTRRSSVPKHSKLAQTAVQRIRTTRAKLVCCVSCVRGADLCGLLGSQHKTRSAIAARSRVVHSTAQCMRVRCPTLRGVATPRRSTAAARVSGAHVAATTPTAPPHAKTTQTPSSCADHAHT